jgi:outer membrane protein
MKQLSKRAVIAAALAASVGLSGAALAQELKIGYVQSERVLREAAPAKAAQARLEAEFSKRERELAEQGTRLKAAADKLDKEAPTLSEAERGRRQRELVEQDRDIQRKRREFQEDLTQRKNEELAAVVERCDAIDGGAVVAEQFAAEVCDQLTAADAEHSRCRQAVPRRATWPAARWRSAP